MSVLQDYVTGMNAPADYKRLLLGVHGLSRRKREQFAALVRQEYDLCEWGGPAVEDYDQWRPRCHHDRLVWFAAIGIAMGHSAIVADNFYGPTADRCLRLLDALNGAESAADVIAVPT